jgi:hypothetical protein
MEGNTMTNERLEHQNPGRDERGELLERIAALETERDEAKQEAADDRASLESVLTERNNLRARVAGLESELDYVVDTLGVPGGIGLNEWTEKVVTRMEAAEARVTELERRDKHLVESASSLATERDRLASRLAAIRQRAWSNDSFASIALAIRGMVGEDAPVQEAKAEQPESSPAESIGTPCDCDGTPVTHEAGAACIADECAPCDGSGAVAGGGQRVLAGAVETCGSCGGSGKKPVPAKEPSTAQLFRLLRAPYLAWEGAPSEPLDQLSTLEHRMGAMERAVKRAIALCDNVINTGSVVDDPVREAAMLRDELGAALTDAPEVYTLEEVERAARGVAAGAMTEEEIQDLLATLQKQGVRTGSAR